MIFTVETQAFAAAVASAAKVIPAKSPWPIMTCLKLVTNDDRVTLIGSDSDTTLEIDVPAEVETEGAICIPFQPLAKFCAAAKPDTIKITITDKEAKAQAGRSRIALSVQSLDDYPHYRPPEGDPVTVDGPTLCHALRFCVAATEEDEVRYNIAGPNFSEGGGFVDVWGTDGKSAHRARIADLDGIGGGGTLPMSAAHVVLALADKAETIDFMICERGWHLMTEGRRVWGKVVESVYPDMERVIGQFNGWRDVATITRDDLTAAVSIATCGTEQDSTKSRNLVIRTAKDSPVIVRGHKVSTGVLHAGRAETEATGLSDFLGVVSSKYLTGATSGMKADDFLIEGAMEGEIANAIRVKPAQASATLDLMALVMAQKANLGELADV